MSLILRNHGHLPKPVRCLGVAHNIGDHLTFLVFDERTRHVLARSVLHPAELNKRVTWDPNLQHGHKQTASIGGDIKPRQSPVTKSNADILLGSPTITPSKLPSTSLSESFPADYDEILPLDTSEDPIVEQSKVIGIKNPQGDGELALSSTPLDEDPNVPQLKRKKKPEKEHEVWRKKAESKRLRKSKRDKTKKVELPKRRPKPRSLLTTDKLGVFGNTVRCLMSTVPLTKANVPLQVKARVSKRHVKIDEKMIDLLAYHQDLRDLDPSVDWSQDNHLWKPEVILAHKGGRKQKVKVLWSDLSSTWEDMHALFLHSPTIVCDYALTHHLLGKAGWHVVSQQVF